MRKPEVSVDILINLQKNISLRVCCFNSNANLKLRWLVTFLFVVEIKCTFNNLFQHNLLLKGIRRYQRYGDTQL